MLKQKIVPPNITFSAFFNASKMFWGPIKGDFFICRTVVWTNRRTRLMLVGFHLICLLVRIGVFQIHFLLKQWKIWHHLFKKWRKVFLVWLNLLIRVFPKRPLIDKSISKTATNFHLDVFEILICLYCFHQRCWIRLDLCNSGYAPGIRERLANNKELIIVQVWKKSVFRKWSCRLKYWTNIMFKE